jgi:hypothetical protein
MNENETASETSAVEIDYTLRSLTNIDPPPSRKPINNLPQPMDHGEKMNLRTAAFRVRKLLPGPLGELLAREFMVWEEFGYRFGAGSIVQAAVTQVLNTPLPREEG